MRTLATFIKFCHGCSPIIFSGGDSFPTDMVDVEETDDAEGDVCGCPLCPLSTMLAARDRTSNGDSGRIGKNIIEDRFPLDENLQDDISGQ